MAEGSNGKQTDWGKILQGTASVVGGLGGLSVGIGAEKIAGMQAGLVRRQGRDMMKKTLADTHQAIGSYVASRGGSGVVSNSAADVERSAVLKGNKAALDQQFNAEVEAINLKTQGKIQKAKGIAAFGSSFMGFV